MPWTAPKSRVITSQVEARLRPKLPNLLLCRPEKSDQALAMVNPFDTITMLTMTDISCLAISIISSS